MKKSMNSSLQLALVAIIATATTAFVPLEVRGQSSSTDSSCPGNAPDNLEAETLAMIAYQGMLKEQGIPASYTLITQVRSGKVTTQQIVEAAYDRCILSTKNNYAEDEEYLGDVKRGLEILAR